MPAPASPHHAPGQQWPAFLVTTEPEVHAASAQQARQQHSGLGGSKPGPAAAVPAMGEEPELAHRRCRGQRGQRGKLPAEPARPDRGAQPGGSRQQQQGLQFPESESGLQLGVHQQEHWPEHQRQRILQSPSAPPPHPAVGFEAAAGAGQLPAAQQQAGGGDGWPQVATAGRDARDRGQAAELRTSHQRPRPTPVPHQAATLLLALQQQQQPALPMLQSREAAQQQPAQLPPPLQQQHRMTASQPEGSPPPPLLGLQELVDALTGSSLVSWQELLEPRAQADQQGALPWPAQQGVAPWAGPGASHTGAAPGRPLPAGMAADAPVQQEQQGQAQAGQQDAPGGGASHSAAAPRHQQAPSLPPSWASMAPASASAGSEWQRSEAAPAPPAVVQAAAAAAAVVPPAQGSPAAGAALATGGIRAPEEAADGMRRGHGPPARPVGLPRQLLQQLLPGEAANAPTGPAQAVRRDARTVPEAPAASSEGAASAAAPATAASSAAHRHAEEQGADEPAPAQAAEASPDSCEARLPARNLAAAEAQEAQARALRLDSSQAVQHANGSRAPPAAETSPGGEVRAGGPDGDLQNLLQYLLPAPAAPAAPRRPAPYRPLAAGGTSDGRPPGGGCPMEAHHSADSAATLAVATGPAPTADESECCLCLAAEPQAVCVPCGHRVLCAACAHVYRDFCLRRGQAECPICRAVLAACQLDGGRLLPYASWRSALVS